jgi:hypothetical protein
VKRNFKYVFCILFSIGAFYASNVFGQSYPLHEAAISGDTGAIEDLIRQGYDVNERDSYLCTPMHCAALNLHLDAIELLKDWGANFKAVARYGFVPLHFAICGLILETKSDCAVDMLGKKLDEDMQGLVNIVFDLFDLPERGQQLEVANRYDSSMEGKASDTRGRALIEKMFNVHIPCEVVEASEGDAESEDEEVVFSALERAGSHAQMIAEIRLLQARSRRQTGRVRAVTELAHRREERRKKGCCSHPSSPTSSVDSDYSFSEEHLRREAQKFRRAECIVCLEKGTDRRLPDVLLGGYLHVGCFKRLKGAYPQEYKNITTADLITLGSFQ